ncbi:MAG: hypothetical protein GEU83_12075 [Pseudonocardiaceae bacterium]|nr:hypothetical protein [Pseudonocardiaceae bacterium]
MSEQRPLDELAEVIREWQQARYLAGVNDAARKRAEARIRDALGDATVGTINGKPVVEIAGEPRRHFRLDEFAEQYPDLAQQFLDYQERERLAMPRQNCGEDRGSAP